MILFFVYRVVVFFNLEFLFCDKIYLYTERTESNYSVDFEEKCNIEVQRNFVDAKLNFRHTTHRTAC